MRCFRTATICNGSALIPLVIPVSRRRANKFITQRQCLAFAYRAKTDFFIFYAFVQLRSAQPLQTRDNSFHGGGDKDRSFREQVIKVQVPAGANRPAGMKYTAVLLGSA